MNDIFIGIMTGTSMDAIDIAAAKFDVIDKNQIEIISFCSYDFPIPLKNYLKEFPKSVSVEEVSQLNFLFTDIIAEAIEKFLKDNSLDKNNIAAIGLHGQTLWHQPESSYFLDRKVKSTLQIGSGPNLAVKTGIRTVYDFRSADIAAGGGGAPLIPIFDYHFLKGDREQVILNIGGISNITYFSENTNKEQIKAFDTGPGNCLIDLAVRKYFDKEYDENGKIAEQGIIDEDLWEKLKKTKYIHKSPPKSTGKELYNEAFLDKLNGFEIQPENLITTLTHLTAWSIAENISEHCTEDKFDLKISGGGSKNGFLIELISKYLPAANISEIIIDGQDITDSREALLMAFLSYMRVNELPSGLPSVTGAESPKVLGSISLP